ncbi:MAG TPA: 2-hydroxyglutaryl-CoA dehydratase [Dehalococcoidia bacterium]|nr:2-hydroxyglutaryl-CoA dehydratase [Dehalococcoidia bacterium]
MVYVSGIDIGSAFSKAVVMAEGQIIAYHIMPSGGDYKRTAKEVAEKALVKAKLSLKDLAFTVATGYGAANVSFSNQEAADISCQGRGATYLFPSARTVIDIGGQFTKVFKVNERGKTTAFLLSEKCAAGSGRFLQVIARVLQIDLEDIGELSLKSKNRVDFNTGCAVFAESEAVSRIAEGASKEDILAGLHRTLAAKIQTMVERLGLEPDCAVVGGGAKDIGLVKSLEERLGCKLLLPEEPQIVAALGAALIAGEKAATIKVSH